MRICHVTSVHKTNDVRIFLKECSSLAKNPSYEVFLVGQGEDRNENNVRIIGCGEPPKRRIERMTLFTKKVIERAIGIDADIYHLHDPELIRYVLALKKRGAAVVFDSHENILDSIDEKTYLPRALRYIAKRYYNNLQKKVYPRLDALIVVSPQMVKDYSKLANNVVMITNYPVITDDHNRTEKEGAILFAGGVSSQWSHKEVLEAIRDLEDCHYYIYGSADKEYLKELESLSIPNFTYGGTVSFIEVQEKLQESEMVVALLKPGKNTFFNEGTLGNTKIFEAMLNKKPVIATGFALWKEIIEDNHCGICVDPSNPDEIKAAIMKLHGLSAKERQRLGENGRRAVLEKYNWNNEEEKLLKLYSQLRRGK